MPSSGIEPHTFPFVAQRHRPIYPSQFKTDLPAHFEVFLSAIRKLWTKKLTIAASP